MNPRRTPLHSILVAFLLILLLVPFGTAWSADAFAPRPFAPVQEGFTDQVDTVLPYHPQRILVQLTSQAFEDSDLHFSREKGAVAPRAQTGLASLDALCAAAGVKTISRPYIEVRNQNKANELGLER